LTAGKWHGHARWEELELCAAGMAAGIQTIIAWTAVKKVDRDGIEIIYECNILNSVAMKKIVQIGRVSFYCK